MIQTSKAAFGNIEAKYSSLFVCYYLMFELTYYNFKNSFVSIANM